MLFYTKNRDDLALAFGGVKSDFIQPQIAQIFTN
jgi:hypothetical protein